MQQFQHMIQDGSIYKETDFRKPVSLYIFKIFQLTACAYR